MNILQTERLTMRPMSQSDCTQFVALKTHPENMAQTHAGVLDARQAETLLASYVRQWRRTNIGMWALIHRDTEQFIGESGFAERCGFEGLTLRYTLDHPWWGRGLAAESVEAAIAYGRKHATTECVSALALEGNVRSCRILDGAGMKLVETGFEGVAGFRRYVLPLND